MKNNILSIITPVLNGAKFIEKNIQSIQTLEVPYEHIIVDGGSTDGTLEIIQKFPHLILLNQTNKLGMYAAISQGFSASCGQYLAYVNADDQVVKDGFERMFNVISNDDKLDLIYSDSEFFYSATGQTKRSNGAPQAKFLLQHGLMPFIQPSTIYRKDTYLEYAALNYTDFKICGDLDMFYRMSLNPNFSYKYVPVLSSTFLKYGESLGDRNTTLYLEEIQKNKLPKPGLLVRIIFKLVRIWTNLFISHS